MDFEDCLYQFYCFGDDAELQLYFEQKCVLCFGLLIRGTEAHVGNGERHWVVQAGLKLTEGLLPSPPEGWDYRLELQFSKRVRPCSGMRATNGSALLK